MRKLRHGDYLAKDYMARKYQNQDLDPDHVAPEQTLYRHVILPENWGF